MIPSLTSADHAANRSLDKYQQRIELRKTYLLLGKSMAEMELRRWDKRRRPAGERVSLRAFGATNAVSRQ